MHAKQRRCAALTAAVVACAAGTAVGQYVKLVPADGALGDGFGWSVALDGEVLVAGGPFDDEFGYQSGEAYVFELVDGTWTEISRLTGSGAQAKDLFGRAVAASGDTAIIGAPQTNNFQARGRAYVFHRLRADWTEAGVLTASDGLKEDHFGWSVSVSGSTAIVGAPSANGPGDWSGSAYVFENIAGEWAEVAKLKGSDLGNVDHFGQSVVLSADLAMVGAPSKSVGGHADVGVVYVFERTGGTWAETAKLLGDPPNGYSPRFGSSISIESDRLVVGATGEDGREWSTGAAHIFELSGGEWVHVTKLVAPDGQTHDYFGASVSVAGDAAVVGAPLDSDFGFRSGSAYLFERKPDGVWTLTAKITGPGADEEVGRGVALSGERLAIGAPRPGSVYIAGLPSAGSPDFNGDGVVDTRDVIDFLDAWAQGDPSADWNWDWRVDSRDLIAFLNDWVAGG